MKRQAFGVFLLLACAFAAAGSAPMVGAEARSREQADTIRVATMPLEPFVIVEDDRLTGFSVDLWNAVAEQLHVQYEWVKVESVQELLAAVQSGKADVGIAGISMTREREQVVDFTLPVFKRGAAGDDLDPIQPLGVDLDRDHLLARIAQGVRAWPSDPVGDGAHHLAG